MIVWRGIEQVGPAAGAFAVTIGNLDGVHLGHRAVLGEVRRQADDADVPSCVITFDPHPMAVLRPDAAPLTLTTTERKLTLLAGVGIDAVLVIPFSPAIAALSADDFVTHYLVAGLAARVVVVGSDFRFGYRARGDVDLLRARGGVDGFAVVEVDPVGDDDTYSSTTIRAAVAAGHVDRARAALGRPHLVEGPVVEGEHRGRELGYPTANLATPSGIAVPADGVYAGWLTRAEGTTFPAAISVGTNPTFGENARRVEAYVLDRDDLELYGEHVAVSFGWHLRGMVAFASIDALLVQMAADCAQTRVLVAASQP